jgi:hypothetical protein
MKARVGKRTVDLTKRDFVGQGGEGSVYIQGDVAYKLYTETDNMIPVGKVAELQALTRPEIIRPMEVIFSSRGAPIGYTMRALADTYPLCQLFTAAFKQRHALASSTALALVRGMRETLDHVHKAHVLVVDANELNFLVDHAFAQVYFIDVDSYQTPHYPATAIMESIRDRHACTFDEGTDWFSWAVVTWQLLTGIHPYKGKHPSIKGLDARMQANASVLQPDVKVPAVCPPWASVVPAAYLDWYRAVFEDGKRLPPPVDFVSAVTLVATAPKVVTGSNLFVIEPLADVGAPVVHAVSARELGSRGLFASTASGAWLYDKADTNPAGRVVHASAVVGWDSPLLFWRDVAGVIHAREIFRPDEISLDVQVVDGVLSYQGCVCLKINGELHEVMARRVGARTIVSTQPRANVMPHATTIYDGVAIQDMLGAWFATIVPERGLCYTAALPDLRGHKVVDARFRGGVLMVVSERSGIYTKSIYKFDRATRAWADARQITDPPSTELNFAVLDTGVCAHVLEDGKLELSHARPGNTGVKVIEDPIIRGDMHLFAEGVSLRFVRGAQIYGIKMK